MAGRGANVLTGFGRRLVERRGRGGIVDDEEGKGDDRVGFGGSEREEVIDGAGRARGREERGDLRPTVRRGERWSARCLERCEGEVVKLTRSSSSSSYGAGVISRMLSLEEKMFEAFG
jgi:hypothetical protein